MTRGLFDYISRLVSCTKHNFAYTFGATMKCIVLLICVLVVAAYGRHVPQPDGSIHGAIQTAMKYLPYPGYRGNYVIPGHRKAKVSPLLMTCFRIPTS